MQIMWIRVIDKSFTLDLKTILIVKEFFSRVRSKRQRLFERSFWNKTSFLPIEYEWNEDDSNLWVWRVLGVKCQNCSN